MMKILGNVLYISFLFSLFLLPACSSDSEPTAITDPVVNQPPGEPDGVKILFIGNSYTGYHDMPSLFRNLAIESGKEVHVDQSVTYNKRLPYFVRDSLTLVKIREHNWDYVIFQQAQFLTESEDRIWYHLDNALEMTQIIREYSPEAKIVLFMEQAYAEGDMTYERGDTFEKMTERVVYGSKVWAEQMGKPIISPVAAAWAEVYKYNFDWRMNKILHDPVDGAHPTLYGAYVTACTFYVTIFKEPIRIDYNPGLDPVFVSEVQRITSDLVLNNLSNWYND